MDWKLAVVLVLLVVAGLAFPHPARVTVLNPLPPREMPAPLSGVRPKVSDRDGERQFEAVAVRILVPPESQLPGRGASQSECPRRQLARALGVGVTPGEGCFVTEVRADGPAARAGVRTGDRLAASPKTCPCTLMPAFLPQKEAYEVAWTVYRPKAEGAAAGGGEQE